MAFTWVRPADLGVLEGRPLLDLGTGDGQTLAAVADTAAGLVAGMDRSIDALRAARHTGIAHLVCGEVLYLPIADRVIGCVLAGDVFHHLDDDSLATTLSEVARVLVPSGLLVAWWYESAARPAPDAPRFPRSFESVAAAAERSFAEVVPLHLSTTLEPSPPTVGLTAFHADRAE
jgi:ubiquinone/menaquinone biosynthesis C-methylase UbiE